jgi:hypothetical protein
VIGTSAKYNAIHGRIKTLGSFPTAQSLGMWTSVVTPFLVAVALTWTNRVWRTFAGVAAILCILALFASELRTGLVALVVGLAVVVCLFPAARSIPGLHLGTTGISVAVATAVVVAAFFVTGTHATDPAHSYASVLTPRQDESVQNRLEKWGQAVVDMENHPLGYGVGTASPAQLRVGRFMLNIGLWSIDNAYLKIALEQGFVVMAFFIATLVMLALQLAGAAIRLPDRRSAGIAMGATGSLAAMALLMTVLVSLDTLQAVALWVIVGLGIAQLAVPRAADATGASQATGASRPAD